MGLSASESNGNAKEITKTCFRAGKPDPDKNRPLVMVLNSKKAKETIFKNAKNLKGKTRWKKVSIKDDKTKLQLHCDKTIYENRLLEAQTKNREMEPDEYEQGYRWTVKRKGNRSTLHKQKFDLKEMSILTNNTLHETFNGFPAG